MADQIKAEIEVPLSLVSAVLVIVFLVVTIMGLSGFLLLVVLDWITLAGAFTAALIAGVGAVLLSILWLKGLPRQT